MCKQLRYYLVLQYKGTYISLQPASINENCSLIYIVFIFPNNCICVSSNWKLVEFHLLQLTAYV